MDLKEAALQAAKELHISKELVFEGFLQSEMLFPGTDWQSQLIKKGEERAVINLMKKQYRKFRTDPDLLNEANTFLAKVASRN